MCATCELAKSATWQDFEGKIRTEYANFRSSGGQGFIGFQIPHSGENSAGHLDIHCPGLHSVIISFDEGETSVTIFDEDGDFENFQIPWQDPHPTNRSLDLLSYVALPWLTPTEATSVFIAAERVTSTLRALGEEPINAWFATCDWIMDYEELDLD